MTFHTHVEYVFGPDLYLKQFLISVWGYALGKTYVRLKEHCGHAVGQTQNGHNLWVMFRD